MTSNRRLRLTVESRADLRDIRRYTTKWWGERQRDIYESALDQALRSLVDFPERGQERADIFPGCRSPLVEQHMIYSRIDGSDLVIGRVLHVSQDVTGKVRP